MKGICATCRWFETPTSQFSNFGRCHRYAPREGFPSVLPDSWCGEFEKHPGIEDHPDHPDNQKPTEEESNGNAE